ncbi:MAG: DEAD/DEAH box helicase family protein [Candidatus Pacearchaeota archaeon]|nr:DEAD/DEAH box helicase family protein [Candidatus Pacearchaeota archaeon]
MAKLDKASGECLKIILKDFSVEHTITSLSKDIGNTRMGIWKTLKKLQSDKLIILMPAGKGKTSTYLIRLNWENKLVEKMLVMLLTEEALKHPRWLDNFSELEDKADFIILYGSILHSPKEASDIDILGVVSDKKKFIQIHKTIDKIQITQIKKIHSMNFTEEELRKELISQKNPSFIDALKKGSILFGQEKFIKFVKNKLEKKYIG